MRALQIEAFGNPTEVVRAVDVLDVGAPVKAFGGDVALVDGP